MTPYPVSAMTVVSLLGSCLPQNLFMQDRIRQDHFSTLLQLFSTHVSHASSKPIYGNYMALSYLQSFIADAQLHIPILSRWLL